MSKQSIITILLIVLISMTGVKAFAYDFAVANADGKTIYYIWANEEKTEVSVSYDYYHDNAVDNNSYSGNIVIPESVVYEGNNYKVSSIRSSAFQYCYELTSVTIPNSVTFIAYRAFLHCSGLTSVTIPNSVTFIGDGAFSYCSGLTSVTIPNSVTYIDKSTFEGCSGLTSVTIPNSVTSIRDKAFSGCSGLTSITIPNSVTSILNNAFRNCSGLTNVDFPNSVKSIGIQSFSCCSGLKTVFIPKSLTSIGIGAFSGCTGLTRIKVEDSNPEYDSRNDCNAIIKTTTNELVAVCNNTIIPQSVTSLGASVYAYCSDLTSYTIPSHVTSIGGGAFRGCSNLSFVNIPNNVISIGEGAFNDCIGLTSITIPINVPLIDEYTFANCTKLKSITIPQNVTKIRMAAFKGCSNLKDFYCWAENVPLTLTYDFKDTPLEYATLHVPAVSINAYKQESPWNEFGKIVALTDNDPKPTGITEVRVTKNDDDIYYDLFGRKVIPNQKGVYIHKGKKQLIK